MINCQNVFAEPVDPVFIGLVHEAKQNISVKAYDSKDIAYIPHNAKFLAETSTGSLAIQHVGSLDEFKINGAKYGSGYVPRYLYLVDFIIRFDFLSIPQFRNTFNFMEK